MSSYNSTSSGTNPDPHTADSSERDESERSPEREHASDRWPREFGGRKKGLEPTRYGDWEKDGRCIDF